MTAKKGRRIKYMGTSDVRVMAAGETFDGRLPDGLPFDLTWDWSNHHVLDLTAVVTGVDDKGRDVVKGLDPQVIDLIVEDNPGAFKDVTDQEVVEPNGAQQLWRGVGANRPVISLSDASVPAGDASSAPSRTGTA